MLPDTRIAIPADVLSQKLDDETVLLNVETGSYFGLTPVASRTWELLQQGRTPSQLLAQLVSEFDAPHSVVEPDLTHFLEDLRAKHLIEL